MESGEPTRRRLAKTLFGLLVFVGLMPAPSQASLAEVSKARAISDTTPALWNGDVPCGDVRQGFADFEFHPHITVNPTNSKNLIATWMQDFGRGSIAAASFDGGAHMGQRGGPRDQ